VEQLLLLHETYFDDCVAPAIRLFAQLDVALSAAKTARKYRYVEPALADDTDGEGEGARASADGGAADRRGSFVRAFGLRHPMIERLVSAQGKKYVTTDIEVSGDRSYLLHGVNSVGKSSLLKSLAIAVIMAQAGQYVAASSLVLRPFRKIFTRTGNDDNMFLHHSSFVKEMAETKAIVRHCDAHSLVVADEVCASTELDSAVQIVGCLLWLLAQRGAAFVFATHLFALQENHHVRQLLRRSLRNVHLRVRFEGKQLVFERTISPGLPENRLYGAMVAEKVIDTPEFTALMAASAKTLGSDSADAPAPHGRPKGPTSSRYNARVWLECCEVCGYRPRQATDMPLDTHHIHAQCSADGDGYVDQHTHKNERHNLVGLCKPCHQATHAGEIAIAGYADTMGGRRLQWQRAAADGATACEGGSVAQAVSQARRR
jgi:DNA mismatch repair protein MutS